MQSIPVSTALPQPPRPAVASAPGEECCTVCLETLETKLPTVTTECGHRSHRGCLNRWRIYSVRPLCPVCRTPLTEETVDDEFVGAAAAPTGPLSSVEFTDALFRVARIYDTRRVEMLLASSSLDAQARRICLAVVNSVINRGFLRLSVMSWRECNQLKNCVDVFLQHGAITASWAASLPDLFATWQEFHYQDKVSAVDFDACMTPGALRAEVLKLSESCDHVRAQRLLDRVGAHERVRGVVRNALDFVLQKALLHRYKTTQCQYILFKNFINVFLCRGIRDGALLAGALQLAVLRGDFPHAATLKDEFGVSLEGSVLHMTLSDAVDAIDTTKVAKLMYLALPGVGVEQVVKSVLQRLLNSVESCAWADQALCGLPGVISIFSQYVALDASQVNKALDLCLHCEAVYEAMEIKYKLGGIMSVRTLGRALQSAANTLDHSKASLLLDMAVEAPLQEKSRAILHGKLRAIYPEAGQITGDERDKLWWFVNVFFQHDIIDAQLVGLAVKIFELTRWDSLVELLKSDYGTYLEPQRSDSLTGSSAAKR